MEHQALLALWMSWTCYRHCRNPSRAGLVVVERAQTLLLLLVGPLSVEVEVHPLSARLRSCCAKMNERVECRMGIGLKD
jgi:hypothetical protein